MVFGEDIASRVVAAETSSSIGFSGIPDEYEVALAVRADDARTLLCSSDIDTGLRPLDRMDGCHGDDSGIGSSRIIPCTLDPANGSAQHLGSQDGLAWLQHGIRTVV